MRIMKKVFISLAPLTLAACTSLTPTYKTEEGYVIYDVSSADKNEIDRNAFLNAVTTVIKKHVAEARINRSIPPNPLPAEPGRFAVTNPFQGTSIGTAIGARGYSMRVATCDGAIMMVSTDSKSMAQYGETQSLSVCVYQYKKGYSVNIYVSSVEQSGGILTIGTDAVKSVLGGSAQFIPRTVNDLKGVLNKFGKVEEREKFIPDSYKGFFYNTDV